MLTAPVQNILDGNVNMMKATNAIRYFHRRFGSRRIICKFVITELMERKVHQCITVASSLLYLVPASRVRCTFLQCCVHVILPLYFTLSIDHNDDYHTVTHSRIDYEIIQRGKESYCPGTNEFLTHAADSE